MIELIIAVIIQVSAINGDVTTTTTSQVTDTTTGTTVTKTTTETADGGTGNWDDNQ